MRRYFLKLAALLFALLLPFLLYFSVIQAAPPQFTASIMGGLRQKIALLEDTPGRRVIFAGGSASPYALDCAALSEALGRPCITIGVTAYFGIDLYLSMLRQGMREGDIVVLMPEHSMLRGSVDYSTLWCGIENFPDAWRVVPLSDWPGLVQNFHLYAKIKQDRAAEHPSVSGENTLFGPLGDVVAHREPQLEQGYNTEDPIDLRPNIIKDDVLNSINQFVDTAENRGISVYFTHAPLDELALTTGQERWAAYEQKLHDSLAAPVLGRVQDAILPGRYFYDSNNHLTTEGATLYTTNMAQLLAGAVSESG